MEVAEAKGRVGRIAFASELTALDCAIGDLKVAKMKASGLDASPAIRFNMDVDFVWQPIESQRLLLWAKQQGKWRRWHERSSNCISSSSKPSPAGRRCWPP